MKTMLRILSYTGLALAMGCGSASKNADNGSTPPAPVAQTPAPVLQPQIIMQAPTTAPAAATSTDSAITTDTATTTATATATAVATGVSTGAPQYVVTVTDSNGTIVDQKAVDLAPDALANPSLLNAALLGNQGALAYRGMRGGQGCFGQWCHTRRHHYPVCVNIRAHTGIMVQGWVWSDNASWIRRMPCDARRMVPQCQHAGSAMGGWVADGTFLTHDSFCADQALDASQMQRDSATLSTENGLTRPTAPDDYLTLQRGDASVRYLPQSDHGTALGDGRTAHIFQRSASN